MNEMKEKGLQKAMRLCSRSEKSALDIRQKLRQWDIEKGLHEEILKELYKANFLDDMRYAKGYVHDKVYLNKWGKQKVYFALKMKEIPEHIIEEAVATIDQKRYEEGVLSLLKNKEKSLKVASSYDKMAKLIRFGQSRGFTMTEINKALNNII